MNQIRPQRQTPPEVVKKQALQLASSLKNLDKEKFNRVFKIKKPGQLDQVQIIFEDSTITNEPAGQDFTADWEENALEMSNN
jgi:predicted kinase